MTGAGSKGREGRVQVVFSERLGELGLLEEAIADGRAADLVVLPLWSEEQILATCLDADVLVVGAPEPVTRRVLEGLPRLRAVVRRGIGVDNVDVGAATALGIPVAFVPAASVDEVSDHALALALTLGRRLPAADAAVRAGDTAGAGRAVSATRRFADSTLGVVGFGRIGRALARKAGSVFGRVLAHDPYADPELVAAAGVEAVTLDRLWAESDVISLHVPSGNGAIVDEAALRAMRPGSVLVNTARGSLVDEDALVAALRRGDIAAAGLDVTGTEPLPADSPLLGCPGLLLTGHTAAKGQASGPALRQAVVDAVVAVLDGQVPVHLADPAVMDRPGCRIGSPSAPSHPSDGPLPWS